ncbi:hypothetical protein [Mycolicibacterium fortuitum]|nr:hypothetical protein [Mycolicibacterium fortuitum]
MGENTAGKKFEDSAELGVTPLTKEEIDTANAQLDAFHSQVVEA